MPNWSGIEDHSTIPARVWLSKVKQTDKWKPLRKVDCKALNNCPADSTTVLIECGRATADIAQGKIRYNYYRGPERYLSSAIWFIVEKDSTKENRVVTPVMNQDDSDKIEELYQKAIAAASSLGDGIQSILKTEAPLEDGTRAIVVKSKDTLFMAKKAKGFFGTASELQRGYGSYVVEGEATELAMGPVRHVAFAIHGIGEAFFSREDVGMNGLVDEINQLRAVMQTKQVEEHEKRCAQVMKEGLVIPLPDPPNRVEFIPVEWYDRIHSSSNELMKSLKAATLPTIPAFRAIANDVVFDVMMYLTPTFCQDVLECVTDQINAQYEAFLKVHPDFIKNGGKCSLIGHSLGSVIVWDLLSIIKEKTEVQQKDGDEDESATPNTEIIHGVNITDEYHADYGYQKYAHEEHANKAANGTWGPSLPKPMERTLPFIPENSILLGSPIGMFLTLRGAHAVFDELRMKAIEKAKRNAGEEGKEAQVNPAAEFVSPFTLPSGSIYNVFHPSDPVAYRIEPLLLPQEMDTHKFPDPVYLTAQGQSLRFHVKARQFQNDIRKTLAFDAVMTKMSSFMSLDKDSLDVSKRGVPDLEPDQWKFPLGGKSRRVDHQLQPGVVDNEYLSAVLAHSNYFASTDLHDVFIDLMATANEQPEREEDGQAEKQSDAMVVKQSDTVAVKQSDTVAVKQSDALVAQPMDTLVEKAAGA